jgi:N-methylhydantoinase B
MRAQIIQTNSTPFAKVAIDPVTLDIIENALRNARVEMDTTLVRTAMSPGIREQGDAFPLIADNMGRMIVGQFGSYIGPFLEGFDGTVEEGDMIFLSDPYSVQGAISHSNDWLVLLPVFKDGRLIAYTSMFGHQSDIGGKVAGSMPIDAHSIFEEGVRIPPVKIWKKGVYNEDLIKLIMHQVRTPEWCKADLNALIAACRVASRRVIEMCERFGDDVFVCATEELLARNHRAMKALIDSSIGDDPVSFEDYICDDGLGYGPYKIRCTMWRENGKVVLDFAGTERRFDQFPAEREHDAHVLRHLHDHGVRPADPVQRRLLRPDRHPHPGRLAAQAQVSGGAVGPHPRPGATVRHPRRPARPKDPAIPQCRRLLVLAAPVLFGAR